MNRVVLPALAAAIYLAFAVGPEAPVKAGQLISLIGIVVASYLGCRLGEWFCERKDRSYIAGIILALAFLALAAPAMAQPKATDLTGLLQQIQADAKAALADAQSHQDAIASTCYAAIVELTGAKLQAQGTTGGGLLLAFQKLRDVNKLNSSPQGTQLIIGCAPLVQDAKVNMLQFFTQIGAAVLLKGVLVP